MADAANNNVFTRPCVGTYRIEDTSTHNFECGKFAHGISTQTQLGIQLTAQEFSEIYATQEMQDFNERQEYFNVENNFYDDQLALVLCLWGPRYGLDNLQLGIILEERYCALLGKDNKYVILSESDMEDEGEFKTVWIHNNNKVELSGCGMNHYSGVSILEAETAKEEGTQDQGMEKEGMEKEEATIEEEATMEQGAKHKRDAAEEEYSDVENNNAAPHAKKRRMDHEVSQPEAPKDQSEDQNVDEGDEVEDSTESQHHVGTSSIAQKQEP